MARHQGLIACEFSGVVRDAFLSRGVDVVSCDLLPSERPGPHLQCDVRTVLADGWRFLIAFPSCQYLAVSGLHWNGRRPGRAAETETALAFVRELLDADVEHIALENPIGCISTRIRQPDQYVQPWQFGDPESKLTCLWLKNLPRLAPPGILYPPQPASGRYANQTASGQNRLPPSPTRWKERSRTYQGIAAAMAEQWGWFLGLNARVHSGSVHCP